MVNVTLDRHMIPEEFPPGFASKEVQAEEHDDVSIVACYIKCLLYDWKSMREWWIRDSDIESIYER